MSPNNWKILIYCSENNFPFFGPSVALYLREIQPPPKYLHASNPPAVSSSNRCRYLPNCLFEIFQCFASTSGDGGVAAQRLGSDRGQSGLEQPLLLVNWDFLLYRQTEFKGKHLRHEIVCPHRARLILHTETVASHGVWIMMTTATSAVAWWSRSRLFNWPQFQDQPLQCNASPDLTSGTAKVLTTSFLSFTAPGVFLLSHLWSKPGSNLWVRSPSHSETLLRLNWYFSGWWRYQLNINWYCK